MSPFGGYKRIGIGRESGQDMIKEYLQVKSVWISTATEVPNPFIQTVRGGDVKQVRWWDSSGVGRMGGPMASRLLDAGHSLCVFDTSAEAVQAAGRRGARGRPRRRRRWRRTRTS